jgi:hypothetical protein
MLSTKPWVRFNPDKNNLTIVPELGTADNDDDKVRDVVALARLVLTLVVISLLLGWDLENKKRLS